MRPIATGSRHTRGQGADKDDDHAVVPVVVCAVPRSGLVSGNAAMVRDLRNAVAPGQSAVIDLVHTSRDMDGDGLAALLSVIATVRLHGGEVAIAARGALSRRLRFVGIERLAAVRGSVALACSAVTTR